jgi:hypothetical protein
MKKNIIPLLTLLPIISCSPDDSETWVIDNLQQIGGHEVAVTGNPKVVETPLGKAVRFDGDGDMLLVDHNPIGDATTFTVEVVFRQDACYPENTAPRFIHIQDPDDERAKRLMIELRVNERNQCYLDAFLKTDSDDLALIDEKLVHPTEKWLHAAVIYENGAMTTYLNGQKELSGQVSFQDTLINPVGKVALGGRMNHVSWFRGEIKTLKVTRRALSPEEFIPLPDPPTR